MFVSLNATSREISIQWQLWVQHRQKQAELDGPVAGGISNNHPICSTAATSAASLDKDAAAGVTLWGRGGVLGSMRCGAAGLPVHLQGHELHMSLNRH